MSDHDGRTAELEAKVERLEATVQGLTEELVEVHDRLETLENAGTGDGRDATPDSRGEASASGSSDPGDADERDRSDDATGDDGGESDGAKGDEPQSEDETGGDSDAGDDIIVA